MFSYWPVDNNAPAKYLLLFLKNKFFGFDIRQVHQRATISMPKKKRGLKTPRAGGGGGRGGTSGEKLVRTSLMCERDLSGQEGQDEGKGLRKKG